MSTIIETKVFTFDELSDDAKEKAREWWRESWWQDSYEWWDSVYDDAKQCGKILGIEIDDIYFSGFWSQGDGAQFVGSYAYAKGSRWKIREHAPGTWTRDGEIHKSDSNLQLAKIADTLQEIQSRHFYGLTAQVSSSGRYSHEMATEIRVYDREGDYATADTAEAIADALRDFMRWIYRRLESEYEFLNSDEIVDETILANGYTFTESGRRFG